MMQTAALQLDRLSVDLQAMAHIRRDRADAGENRSLVKERFSLRQRKNMRAELPHRLRADPETVKGWLLRAPERRIIHRQRVFCHLPRMRIHLNPGSARNHLPAAALLRQDKRHIHKKIPVCVIGRLRLHLQISGLRAAVRPVLNPVRVQKQRILHHGQLRPVEHPDTPEEARTGIPARVRLHTRIDRDTQIILLSEIKIRRDIRAERRISVMLQTNPAAVHLHRGIHHRPFKIKKNLFSIPLRRNVDPLRVMRHPGIIEPAGSSRRRIPVHISRDHVIVRQINRLPTRSRHQPLIRTTCPQPEFPAPVQIFSLHTLPPVILSLTSLACSGQLLSRTS